MTGRPWNFAPPALAGRGDWIALLLALALTAACATKVILSQSLDRERQAALQRSAEPGHTPQVSERESREAAAVEAAMKQWKQQLARPWGDLLAGIERAHLPELRMLAIEPDADRGSVLLTAEVSDAEVGFRWMDRLKLAGLTYARLRSVQRPRDSKDDTASNLVIILEAGWPDVTASDDPNRGPARIAAAVQQP